MGRGTFEVQGGLWPVEEEGPPLVYEETVDHGELAPTAAALELGLFGSKPMVGERKVLLIHLDTASRRFPPDLDTDGWGEIFDSSKAPSVRRYIEEVSDWKLDIQVRGASMVLHLPESFDA